MPIEIIKGKLIAGSSIKFGNIEIGKVLIDNEYPFALIKYLDDYFDEKNQFTCENALIKIRIPDWIK